jgi:hypothetical protein
MKNAVFFDEAPCRYFVNRSFGGTYGLHLQGIRNPRAMNQSEQRIFYTRPHIPEDGILHSHRHENPKSEKVKISQETTRSTFNSEDNIKHNL